MFTHLLYDIMIYISRSSRCYIYETL